MRRQSRRTPMGAAMDRFTALRRHGRVAKRPGRHAAFRGRAAGILLALLAGGVFPAGVRAHPLLGDCVQHRIFLTVDPANIDIEIELTFTDARAMAERRRMDVDRDWTLDSEEIRRYAGALESTQPEALVLAIDGQPVRLIALYTPEVDLLGVSSVAPTRLIVRLFYFAPTPPFLKAGSALTLVNRLQPDAPAMLAMTVAGEGGVRITTTPTDPLVPAGPADSSRLLHARCAAIPEGGVGQIEEAANRPPHLATTTSRPLAVQEQNFPRTLRAAALFTVALVAAAIYRYRPRHNALDRSNS